MELFARVEEVAERLGAAVVADGSNRTTRAITGRAAGRPGAERPQPVGRVRLTKAELRRLAEVWGLPVGDKPATPCLSSRIAYGQRVTPERLRDDRPGGAVPAGAGIPAAAGPLPQGDLARIEVPLGPICPRLAEPSSAARWSSISARWASSTSRSTWKVSAAAA